VVVNLSALQTNVSRESVRSSREAARALNRLAEILINNGPGSRTQRVYPMKLLDRAQLSSRQFFSLHHGRKSL
jgi:hypothetical protein